MKLVWPCDPDTAPPSHSGFMRQNLALIGQVVLEKMFDIMGVDDDKDDGRRRMGILEVHM